MGFTGIKRRDELVLPGKEQLCFDFASWLWLLPQSFKFKPKLDEALAALLSAGILEAVLVPFHVSSVSCLHETPSSLFFPCLPSLVLNPGDEVWN